MFATYFERNVFRVGNYTIELPLSVELTEDWSSVDSASVKAEEIGLTSENFTLFNKSIHLSAPNIICIKNSCGYFTHFVIIKYYYVM